MQARLTATSTGTALIPGLVLVGLGVAADLPTMASASLAAVPHERSGMAGGAMNTFRQLGFALGVAVFGSIFTNRLASHHPTTPASAHAAAADAVNHVVTVAGWIALAGAALVLLLVRTARPAWETQPATTTRPAPSPAAHGAV
ncbi:hypothetical protein ABT297_12935 [Dactylosporangium sp. NPDC000555]|uniref:hypothetical protein n=1 Tax=Dactylosporangium sp. NPDC000555 TaxID=3154260 RepID=UPI00332BE02B